MGGKKKGDEGRGATLSQATHSLCTVEKRCTCSAADGKPSGLSTREWHNLIVLFAGSPELPCAPGLWLGRSGSKEPLQVLPQ